MLKRLMQKAANQFGYRIVKDVPEKDRTPSGPSPYHTGILSMLARKDHINIVVVGANDGKINDPIYELIRTKLAQRVRLLLVEPQTSLIPIIEQNYDFLPSKRLVNCAIGEEGELELYTIKKEYWGRLDVPYARGWPAYRAPTGVTSANKKHLVGWLKTYLGDHDPDDVIEIIRVPSKPLTRVLHEENFPEQIDILQVDVEGNEDIAIFSADLARTRPAIVFFESKHIASERAQRLNEYLAAQGYKTFRMGGDTLAILEN
jgi:FkbM family methyltransferase